MVVNFPATFFLSLFKHIALPLSSRENLVSFLAADVCSSYIFRIRALCTRSLTLPPSTPSIHRPPHAPFLYFVIYFLLLLAPLCHCQISPVCSSLSSPFPPSYLYSVSFTHPLLSLSVSLFCDCSGWSPCGTLCRVPNLFIISALCQDAWGMLKYTPPRSGYKWAGVPPSFPPAPTAQPTRPLGWTDLTSQTQTQTLKIITTPQRRRLSTAKNQVISVYN